MVGCIIYFSIIFVLIYFAPTYFILIYMNDGFVRSIWVKLLCQFGLMTLNKERGE